MKRYWITLRDKDTGGREVVACSAESFVEALGEAEFYARQLDNSDVYAIEVEA